MIAYVIKTKKGKYLNDFQQQPFFDTDDITKTRFYKTYEKAKENCRHENDIIVKVIIKEED